jgi:hypothetical protein
MATRFIHKGLALESSPYSHVAPFGVNENGELQVNRGAENKGNGLTSDPGAEPIAVGRVIIASASFTLAARDNGATIIADSTTSVVVQLPSTAKGLRYTLSVKQLTSSGGHAFSPAAADKIYYGPVGALADDTDLVCSAATDRVGDSLTLVGDGVDGWVVISAVGTWA